MEPTSTSFREFGADKSAQASEQNADAFASASALYSSAFDLELSRRYKAAKDARQEIEREMLADLRRRDGEYEPDIKARIEQQGGSATFDNVTDTKCNGIEAMLAELLVFSGDKPWGLDPTPIPELDAVAEAEAYRSVVEGLMADGIDPATEDFSGEFAELVERAKEEVKAYIEQEAKRRADGMEELIADQLAEGGMDDALNDFMSDFATHKVAALMGPCPRMKILPVVEGGQVIFREKMILAVERISPLNLYPESLSAKPGDGDFFVRKPMSNDAARRLKAIPGVKADRFAEAFAKSGKPGDETMDSQVEQIIQKTTGTNTQKPDPEHELIYWWHWMTREEVARFDGAATIEDQIAGELVPMTGLMLNGVVIKAVENLDKTGTPNVFVASYRRQAGSFWGKGGAALAKSQQEQVNAISRALSNNVAMSSVPSYEVDSSLLVDPQAMSKSFPGQRIYKAGNPNDQRRAVQLLETPNFTMPLLAARDKAAGWLDEKSGVYPQSYGSPAQTGPAETLGGYQLLRADQTKTMKRALYNVSMAIGGLVHAYWLWNMIFSEDEDIKGDFQVVARGPVQSFITTEDADQMLAILDLLAKYPILQSSALPSGPAHLLREAMKARRIKTDKVLKSESDIEAETNAAKEAEEQAQEAQQQQSPDEAMEQPAAQQVETESATIRANADMMRAQAAMAKVEIDRERKQEERAERLLRIRKAQQEIAARERASVPMSAGAGYASGGLPMQGAMQ